MTVVQHCDNIDPEKEECKNVPRGEIGAKSVENFKNTHAFLYYPFILSMGMYSFSGDKCAENIRPFQDYVYEHISISTTLQKSNQIALRRKSL